MGNRAVTRHHVSRGGDGTKVFITIAIFGRGSGCIMGYVAINMPRGGGVRTEILMSLPCLKWVRVEHGLYTV